MIPSGNYTYINVGRNPILGPISISCFITFVILEHIQNIKLLTDSFESLLQWKLKDRLKISLLILHKFKRINLYFPWNHQKNLCIKGEGKLIN